MDQIKAHYDRYLLILGGLVLAAVALLMAMNAGQLSSEFAPVPPPTSGEAFAQDASIARLRADRTQMEARHTWQAGEGSLFISRVYLLRDGALVDILESGSELFAGIPNSWILEHNLDYTSTAMPDNDPDEDGFTNREEFEGKTNPQDRASKPALWTKLRLIDSKIDKLRFKFMSLPTGSLSEVSINTVTAENPQERSGSTQFYPRTSEEVRTAEGMEKVDKNIILLAGRSTDGTEVFEITPFKFVRGENRREMNRATNIEEDVPSAVLLNTADGKEIILPLAKEGDGPIDSPYAVATIKDTRSGGQTYQLSSGKTFQIGEADTYKLVDVKNEKAIIENLQTGDRHDIPFQGAAPAAEAPSESTPQ
jgi:hypothetical protein